MSADVVVVDDHGRDSASTETTGRFKRDSRPRQVLAGMKPNLILNRRQQGARSVDEARGTETNGTLMLASRLESKQVIKRCHSINMAGRQLQTLCDVMEDRNVEMTEEFLRGMKHLDQGVRSMMLALHGSVETEEPGITARVRLGVGPLGYEMLLRIHLAASVLRKWIRVLGEAGFSRKDLRGYEQVSPIGRATKTPLMRTFA